MELYYNPAWYANCKIYEVITKPAKSVALKASAQMGLPLPILGPDRDNTEVGCTADAVVLGYWLAHDDGYFLLQLRRIRIYYTKILKNIIGFVRPHVGLYEYIYCPLVGLTHGG